MFSAFPFSVLISLLFPLMLSPLLCSRISQIESVQWSLQLKPVKDIHMPATPMTHIKPALKNGQVCKPGSVFDDHLSRRNISARSCGPPSGRRRATALRPPTLLRMGFTRPLRLRNAGELLPHHFQPYHGITRFGGMFLLHFPYSYLRRTLSRHPCPVEPGLSSCLRHATI